MRNKAVEKDCPICGYKFFQYLSDGRKDTCCSFSCGQKYRRQKAHEAYLSLSSDEKLKDLKARYEKHVIKKDGCWDWNAAKVLGYGTIKVCRKQLKAHRISWMIHRGEIPHGMFVLHKCVNNRQCTNPDHLYLGSFVENHLDKVDAGNIGIKTSLTAELVMEIRKLIEFGIPCTKIAPKFNVSVYTIYDIKHKKTWGYLP